MNDRISDMLKDFSLAKAFGEIVIKFEHGEPVHAHKTVSVRLRPPTK